MDKLMSQKGKQSGAALIVSMVLLMVLTMLAISTMSTASMEVTMAGNKQFANNAFQLAETGNDEFIARAIVNPACANTVTPGVCDIANTQVADMNGEYSARGDFMGDTEGCPGGYSEGIFATYHFEVQSTGQTNARGASSQHAQGWTVCRNK
jgi:type IV pilus assembly protein PilX